MLKVFEATPSDTKARIIGKVSHHGLTAVQRVGSDTFVFSESVNIFTNHYISCVSARSYHIASDEYLSPFQCSPIPGVSVSSIGDLDIFLFCS